LDQAVRLIAAAALLAIGVAQEHDEILLWRMEDQIIDIAKHPSRRFNKKRITEVGSAGKPLRKAQQLLLLHR
jgi:hypothetical protein